MEEYLFVYGTLRKDTETQMHQLLMHYCDHINNGYFTGKLYEISGYPGAVESLNETEKVYGELYRINSDAVLPLIDDYEECSEQFSLPHEYVRKKVIVYINDCSVVNAWCYIYNFCTLKLRQIPSGNYINS